MAKVSYIDVLKETISEFDTSQMTDAKGPMLEPILSYTGDGEMETHRPDKNIASVLERYYFHEKEAKSISLPDEKIPYTGEVEDIEQPEKEDLSKAKKIKNAAKDELKGDTGSIEEEIIESDNSIEDRLMEIETSFLTEMEEEIEEGTGPGGHEADGTGPHGAGAGPGKGKADGSGMESDEGDEGEKVCEDFEPSIEDRLIALENEISEEDDSLSEDIKDFSAEDEALTESANDEDFSIENIERTVLESLIDEMEGDDEGDAEEGTPEEEAGETPEEEKAEEAPDEKEEVLDIDKKITEGDALGPIGVTAEDEDEDSSIQEMLSLIESEIEDDTADADLDIKPIKEKIKDLKI